MSVNNTITKSKIQLKGMNHFGLNVKNMDVAVEFYSNVLGFPVINRTETSAGNKHFEVDVGNVAIALFESPDLDLKSAHKVFTEEGFLHFAFTTTKDQFQVILQELKDQNVKIDGEPRIYTGGASAYFFDPDGHHLEIHYDEEN
jgi:catechol 2,3-dioxygenase-like lactoylglutathione lyase family enzyme